MKTNKQQEGNPMKKKIIIAMVLAALVAVPVFAASNDNNGMQNYCSAQMPQNHQQMIQQAVDNGTISADEAAMMNENMQEMTPVMEKMMKNGGMMQNGGMMKNGGMMHDRMMGNFNKDK
jgi:FlaG/FlaF family flagellin (archaellin)